MNKEMIDLAHRVVACKGWRWLPGMRAIGKNTTYPVRFCDYGERVFDTMDLDEIEWWQQPGGKDMLDGGPYPGPYLPDLTDPATLGCLLQLVREAWGMPTGITVSYSSDDGLWGVSWSGATHGGWCGRGKTEAEALFVALEAAP